MRVVFMGTPEFSVSALKRLVEAGHEIVCVYTQPPRPAGRGKAPRPTSVAIAAEALGLPIRSPVNFKDADEIARFKELDADVAVIVAYGLLLPAPILEAPSKGCLNIHASLLPRWRGAAPIHRAIMAGDTETGVCIMQMDEGLDTGDVVSRAKTQITSADTTETLHDRLAELGADQIVKVLALDTWMAEPQDIVGITYAKKIEKAEARVDWTRSAAEVDCHIRGLSRFPGAWSMLNGERIKFLLSRIAEGSGPAGVAIDDEMTISTGEGTVKILRAQRSGKAEASIEDFLRGMPVPQGSEFE